jgi:ABC-type phosphate transport system ATPase subunit
MLKDIFRENKIKDPRSELKRDIFLHVGSLFSACKKVYCIIIVRFFSEARAGRCSDRIPFLANRTLSYRESVVSF